MNFDIPQEMQEYLDELDQFIENTIKPLENENDNIRFFDHRREDARTDWERGGLPNEEWEALLSKTAAAPWIPPIKNPLDTSNFDPYDEHDDVVEKYVETADRWYEGF